ncbi:AraC family transcriptional regulator [Bacteriovorax stolpii]|uniref:Uncharacterized protein n=1 Tax=Bacteriovorax stolpii TaxID=960 RepID=A0A2K9NV28_BACTC|nr:AraC family transcriptional regulator [Bacteriovorax stolpii]AUN99369.1 hypothetical protein C0V70_14900 [Bacteriovorax stolpii]QDK40651.1 AraC family transcriptional regulator [Bacteriovorax stolpii]TDP55089.1 AraC family transcriptional regulator [Bacteriovorax stolpii]
MKKKSPVVLKNFHRSQVGRAQRFIRSHFTEELTLKKIAQEAGSSAFHFGRIFMSYTGETTFSYLRRIRMSNALRMLQEDNECPVTEIALSIGYETPSAFNKAFKQQFNLSPSDFRNQGKEEQNKLIYSLSISQTNEEMLMNLNLTEKPEIITREATHFLHVKKAGIFAEVAMPAWYAMFPLIESVQKTDIKEFLGTSIMDMKTQDESSMFYSAGVALVAKPKTVPKGMEYTKITEGKYARFILTGPYPGVWPAFEKIFRILIEKRIKLRDGACIENYLNDPNVTPEHELITELLVPVE